MRILNLIPNLSGGGAERQLSFLAPELARMGYDVHIAYSNDGPHKSELSGVVLHKLKARSNYDPYLLWQLFRLIQCIKPDIIHTWILQMDILGGALARLNGVPWIFREPSSAKAYLATWKHYLRVRVGSGANAIVSNSAGGDDYWRNHLPYSRRYVIANGLPFSEIESIEAALPPGIPDPQTPIVLYAGRLTSDASAMKNLKALLESLVYVKQQIKMQCILCGEGPQRRELEMVRHKLGLDADVHFMGHLPITSVWALMKKASLFVSLSAYEGCPNTVMEAMACACPLILSDIPAHRELANDSWALFVDPSDTKQTANAIITTLNKLNAAKERALAAKGKVHEWSIEKMARNYEKLYKNLI